MSGLSDAQWETILDEADPQTYGEVLETLRSRSEFFDGDARDVLDAALDDVLIEGDDWTIEIASDADTTDDTDTDRHGEDIAHGDISNGGEDDTIPLEQYDPKGYADGDSSDAKARDAAIALTASRWGPPFATAPDDAGEWWEPAYKAACTVVESAVTDALATEETGSSTDGEKPPEDGEYDDVDWSEVDSDVDPAGVDNYDAWMPAQEKKPWNPGASTENTRSWSNPENWTTSEKTHEWVKMHPQLDGRAFILQGDGDEQNYNGDPDPFLFVDYDDVVEDGEPTDEAKALMGRLGMTYTDFSSSGTGNHQIFDGALPEDVRTIQFELETGEVEIYDQRRVCIMTGKHVQDTPIEPQPVDEDALEALADEHGKKTSTVSREEWEPEYSRDDLAEMDEADDLQAIFDAIQQVEPRDIRLHSSLTEERPDGTLSFDPTFANSNSGKRLGWDPDIGFIYREGDRGLDALAVVALEEGIITSVQDYPRGEDWWRAVDALRDRGARIPELSDDLESNRDEDVHPLLEAAWELDADVDAAPTSAIPLGQLEALPQQDRRRAAKKRGLDWPTTREARDRLEDTIKQAMRHEDETVIDAPTSLGKSYTIASKHWGMWNDVTGGQRVVHLSATRDSRDEAATAARENDVDHFVLLGRHEACPIAGGDYDPRQCEETEKTPLTVDGTPASQWIDQQADGKGLPYSLVHKMLEDEKDQDGPLPCCAGNSQCRSITQWEDLRESDASLVIATHNFAHVPSLRLHGNIVIDEEPDFDAGLGDDLDERKTRIERAVTAYLKEADAVVQNWESFIGLADTDYGAGDAAREADQLQSDLDHEPDPEWYFENADAHTLAPALARAIFHAEPRANGRRVGKTVHEPPRLDAQATDEDGWNREWLTVVLDDDNQIRKVRDVPDFSQARSVIGLDAHPSVPVWSANTVPHINTTQVLDPEERRLWRRYERGLRVVQVGDATRPLASGEYWKDDQVRTLVEHLRAEYGDDFQTAITTSACEDRLRDVLEDAGVHDVNDRTMHYGEEKSRNDFANERAGLIEGCIDPGDEYVLDLLAELDLEAEPATTIDEDGIEHREHGRTFDGPDADQAAAILASVRENHTAQAAGRYARDPDNPDSHATVFVRTDAMPSDFADIQVSGIQWTFTATQRAIVQELRDSTSRPSTQELATEVDCSKEHVRMTLRRLEEMDAVQAYEGAGDHGATLYADSGLPNAGVVDLGDIANDAVLDSYTWSLAIRDPVAPETAVTTAANGGDGAAAADGDVWDWRNTSG